MNSFIAPSTIFLPFISVNPPSDGRSMNQLWRVFWILYPISYTLTVNQNRSRPPRTSRKPISQSIDSPFILSIKKLQHGPSYFSPSSAKDVKALREAVRVEVGIMRTFTISSDFVGVGMGVQGYVDGGMGVRRGSEGL